MKQINEFIDWYSEGNFNLFKSFNDKYYLKEIEDSIKAFKHQSERDYIGASGLGKPLVQLALKKLRFPQADMSDVKNKTMLIFHFGHVFEAFLICLLKEFGLYVSDEQREVIYETQDTREYKGHIDGIVNNKCLIEVKTMSGAYFKQFVKSPNNLRGYYTQLAFYWFGLLKQGLPLESCGWVCFNKEDFSIAFVQPDLHELEKQYEIIHHKIEVLSKIETIVDVLDVPLPDLRLEVFKKEYTGKFLVPTSFNRFPYRDCFYNLYQARDGYNKLKTYVDNENPLPKIEILKRLINRKSELEIKQVEKLLS